MDTKQNTLTMLFPIPPQITYPPNLTIINTININETTHTFTPKILNQTFIMEFNKINYHITFDNHPAFETTQPLLQTLHETLSPNNHHFGYQITNKILNYVIESSKTLSPKNTNFLILNKVLPKLQNTKQQLHKPLKTLRNVYNTQKAPHTDTKIDHMLTQLNENNFANFF